MAMLAEPRNRQKWTLNPRGMAWSNDENKFGKKLLEKMGWSKGKGLGRDGQGMQDHISVTIKANTKGIGYKGKDDEWIKHYEGFENVLATLNNEENSTANSLNNSNTNSAANSEDDEAGQSSTTIKSLELKSKTSRARVHYHKFTRGKDVSRYNADDIGCILGSKRAKILADIEAQEQIALGEEAEMDEEGQATKMNGVITIKQGATVQEYFAQKMEALKRKSTLGPQESDNAAIKEEIEEKWEEIEKSSKKRKKKGKFEHNKQENERMGTDEGYDDELLSECPPTQENGVHKKKKKKKKDKRDIQIDCVVLDDSAGDVTTETKEKKKKRKKKDKKDFIDDDCVMLDDNDSCEQTYTEMKEGQGKVSKSETKQDTGSANGITKKKKKKRKYREIEECVKEAEAEVQSSNSDSVMPQGEENLSENAVTKKKKKKRHEEIEKDETDKHTDSASETKKAERKKCKKDLQEVDDVIELSDEVVENDKRSKKKKRKRKHIEAEDDEQESESTEDVAEVAISKKKKKKVCDEDVVEVVVSKKKKKDKFC